MGSCEIFRTNGPFTHGFEQAIALKGDDENMLVEGAGPRLLYVAVALALCVGWVNTKGHGFDSRAVIEELNAVQSYMEELEFIEAKEESYGIRGTESVAEETKSKLCMKLTEDGIKVNKGDDYLGEVKVDVKNWDDCLRLMTNRLTVADWNFETDITNTEKEENFNEASLEFSKWYKGLARDALRYINDNRYSTLDPDFQRKLRFMAFSTDPADENQMKELVDALTNLQETYSKATVKSELNETDVKLLKLEPDLTKIMAQSRDSNLLLATWWGWRNATGRFMKKDYSNLVRLLNKGARDNNFKNYADAWIQSQFDETPDLETITENLWTNMLPLYEQLHAYIRTKLQQKYPEYNHIFDKGGIPAHLLGNMWAQNWENIYDLVAPFPEINEPDYDAELKAQGYTVDKMFKTAEQFYKSIGLYPMSREFNELSMKERPEDKEVVCHASASDFYSKKPKKDFRIKMCTVIDMDSFETIHHEMGHIEYFMAYQDQPAIYRNGANSAFHEAIGDTISLSVRSTKHLETIGLVGSKDQDRHSLLKSKRRRLIQLIRILEDREKRDINFLLKRALFKIGFLPFGYMIDKWRWGVFRGDIKEENYNQEWWKLRLQYQGLVAPVTRSEADFDPGAKYHIPSNSPYICYFISFIVQFQFYEAMCKESGHKGPLFKCDFYNSKKAGAKLLDMMKLGNSKPWPEAMKKLTESEEISTGAILDYFKPLKIWLEEENRRSCQNKLEK